MADELTNLFAEILVVDATSLSDASSPKTVPEWDSVAVMSLVAAIEETFEVRLSTGEITAMRTIGLARQVLREKGVSRV